MYAREDAAADAMWRELPTADHVDAAATAFRMLSDPTRVRVLWLLCGSDHDVTTLANEIGAARPAISQHLAKLRLAGLVSLRREGRRAIYTARGGHVRRLLAEAVQAADHHLTGTADHD